MAYDMTAGEFDLNDTDMDKSSGVLFPACQLIYQQKGRTSI
jgi:hypothetical protein